jgi:signal transduction histidine kinase
MRTATIICVDDEKFILTALRSQINRHFEGEFRIETAESASEALEIVEEMIANKEELPLIISDQIMPGMKGDALLKLVHQQLPKTLTILLTGQADTVAIGNAVNHARLYRYIPKPWEETDMVLTIKEALKSFYQDKKIEEKNTELEELNKTLEEKIVQRTREVVHQKNEIETQNHRIQEQNQKLVELNATKDKLFTILAHDLKNPFNSLLGFSEMVVELWHRQSSAESLEMVKLIRGTAKNGFDLLENLLHWANCQTDRVEVNAVEVNLFAIVEKNKGLLNSMAAKKRIQIINNIAGNVVCFADKNLINTVMRNLISNALKFTETNGIITVNTEPYNDTEAQIKGFLVVTVSDTGVGISPENIQKLFRSDIHFTTSGSENETGTGLGLILCKEFTEKNGGKIWVESKIGIGTNFKFTVPIP